MLGSLPDRPNHTSLATHESMEAYLESLDDSASLKSSKLDHNRLRRQRQTELKRQVQYEAQRSAPSPMPTLMRTPVYCESEVQLSPRRPFQPRKRLSQPTKVTPAAGQRCSLPAQSSDEHSVIAPRRRSSLPSRHISTGPSRPTLDKSSTSRQGLATVGCTAHSRGQGPAPSTSDGSPPLSLIKVMSDVL